MNTDFFKTTLLLAALLVGTGARADLITDLEFVLTETPESLMCEFDDPDQRKGFDGFRDQFAELKADFDAARLSKIEVQDFGYYSAVLKDTRTGQECRLINHDRCFSFSCLDSKGR